MAEVVITYRLHWRERHGRSHAVQWLEVRGARCEIVEQARVAARRSTDGTVRLSLRNAGCDRAAVRAVVTDEAALGAWTGRGRLPGPAKKNDWSKTVSRRNVRVANFRRLQSLLRRFVAEGLLKTEQAVGIAREVSLALDGTGRFTRRSGRR